MFILSDLLFGFIRFDAYLVISLFQMKDNPKYTYELFTQDLKIQTASTEKRDKDNSYPRDAENHEQGEKFQH